jgi:hypothetical protein
MKNTESGPEHLQPIELRSVFPLKKGQMYDYYKSRDELTSFQHPKFGEIETTKFTLSSNFEYVGNKILNGLKAIREKTTPGEESKIIFEPINQSKNDVDQQTCTVATAANIVRALMQDNFITEQSILEEVSEDDFHDEGQLSLSTALEILDKNYPLEAVSFDDRDPEQLIDLLKSGGVAQVVYEGHARLISGYFTNEDNEVFLIVNDPLPDRSSEYALNLEELYTVHFSHGTLSFAGYKTRNE